MDELPPTLAFLFYQPRPGSDFTQPQLLSTHWLTTDPGYLQEMAFGPAKEGDSLWGHYVLWQTESQAEYGITEQLESERHAMFHDLIENVAWKGILNGRELDDERVAQIATTPLLEASVFTLKNQTALAAGHAFYEEILATLRGIKTVLFLPEYGENPGQALALIAWDHARAHKSMSPKMQEAPSWQAFDAASELVLGPVLLRPGNL